jgi:hypothetical protein
LDPTTRQPLLSPCTFPDGSSAWLHPQLADASPAFNDTAYLGQFPLPAELYGLAQLHSLDGDGLLQQAQLADANTHAWENVTHTEYSKWMLQVSHWLAGCTEQRGCAAGIRACRRVLFQVPAHTHV